MLYLVQKGWRVDVLSRVRIVGDTPHHPPLFGHASQESIEIQHRVGLSDEERQCQGQNREEEQTQCLPEVSCALLLEIEDVGTQDHQGERRGTELGGQRQP